jgi:hypothetical protein
MKQVISHNTRGLSIAGVLDQDQIKIGSGAGSNIGIYFDTGKENLPGIRFASGSWEYSVDGVNWNTIGGGVSLAYEPIHITTADLDATGVATIQHNLGTQYPLGLNWSVEPDKIEFVDENTLKLYYDKHSSVDANVWFAGSVQSMLVQPAAPPTFSVTGAGTAEVNGDYTEVPAAEFSQYVTESTLAQSTENVLWTNGTHVLYGYDRESTKFLVFVPKGWDNVGNPPLYNCVGADFNNIPGASWNVVGGTSPAPTITAY